MTPHVKFGNELTAFSVEGTVKNGQVERMPDDFPLSFFLAPLEGRRVRVTVEVILPQQ